MSTADMSVACPACHETICVPANWVGKRRPCPRCKEWVTIPAAAAEKTVSAPPAGGAPPGLAGAGAPASKPPAPDASLSFAERMKLAAERGTTQVKMKEEERARRAAARAQTPTFEEKMRAAKMSLGAGAAGAGAAAVGHTLPDAAPPAVAREAAPTAGASGGAAAHAPATTGATAGTAGAVGVGVAGREWGRGAAPGTEQDEERRLEREEKLREASRAPEKIGQMSVALCGIAVLVLALSMGVFCMGGVSAMSSMGPPDGSGQFAEGPSFVSGAIMAFGVCMFGFSPICSVCGLILGVHSLIRSRNSKVWGLVGTILNGLFILPPAILFLMILASI